MKKLILLLLSSLLLSTTLYSSTIEDKIAGLYISFFNRAADKSGLEYWKTQSESLGEDIAISTLAAGFATHPKFTSLYNHLLNKEYVEEIYINSLGQAGDSIGVNYWKDLLDNGMTRSDMVATFISLSLDFNRSDSQYVGLSQADLDAADERRDLIANKVESSLYFIEILGNATNLDSNTNALDPDALDNDETYKASVSILSDITHNADTKNTVLNFIGSLIDNTSTSMAIINKILELSGSITDDSSLLYQAIEAIESSSNQGDIGSYDFIFIYKNISNTYIDTAINNYQDLNGFHIESSNSSKSCSEYGYTGTPILVTVVGIKTSTYIGSTYGKVCYEVDYSGSPYQTGTSSYIFVYNN